MDWENRLVADEEAVRLKRKRHAKREAQEVGQKEDRTCNIRRETLPAVPLRPLGDQHLDRLLRRKGEGSPRRVHHQLKSFVNLAFFRSATSSPSRRAPSISPVDARAFFRAE